MPHIVLPELSIWIKTQEASLARPLPKQLSAIQEGKKDLSRLRSLEGNRNTNLVMGKEGYCDEHPLGKKKNEDPKTVALLGRFFCFTAIWE